MRPLEWGGPPPLGGLKILGEGVVGGRVRVHLDDLDSFSKTIHEAMVFIIFSLIRLALGVLTYLCKGIGQRGAKIPRIPGSPSRFLRPWVPRGPAKSGSLASFCFVLLCLALLS